MAGMQQNVKIFAAQDLPQKAMILVGTQQIVVLSMGAIQA
jgi:hypothetical protein